jgi:hypothetical protein
VAVEESNMQEALVVVYSNTGTSRRLAQLLCAQLGWPMGQITETRSRAGVAGNLRCALDSVLRRKPKVRYAGPDPAGFRTVVLVAPIWMYRLASPMRSFVAQWRKQLPQVAVASVMGGQGAPNAVAEIGDLLGRSPLLSTAFTAREVEDGSCAGRSEAFGHAIRSATAAKQPVRPAVWSTEAV